MDLTNEKEQKEQQSFVNEAYALAMEELRANYAEVKTSDESYSRVILAGKRNFREFWTRDACFAALGANRIGDFDVVKNTLSLLFSNQREDGMLPRRMSTISNLKRTLGIVLRKDLFKHDSVAKPEYETGHRTTPLDQNALAVITLVDYVIHTGDKEFASLCYPNAERALTWLASKQDEADMLVVQEAYADWIDLVKRPGKSLYTNVCYYKALAGMAVLAKVLGKEEDMNKYTIVAQEVKKNIHATFWMEERGYYRNTDMLENFESSGNVLAIVFDIADLTQAERILDKITHNALDLGMPLKTVDTKYPFSQIALDTMALGWSNYQNGYAWQWIGNMYLVALQKSGRESLAKEQLEKISKFILRYNGFFEVYRNDAPINSLTYPSESGFSWSAGTFIFALHKTGFKK